MLRHRLVRQSAMNVSSGSESSSMLSPQPTRRRRSSQENSLYRPLSTESLEDLLFSADPSECHSPDNSKRRGRRHSVACGVLYVDLQKPSLKAAFNSAVRRVSGACSLLSSAPSSTYNLSYPEGTKGKKEQEVLLPHVLATYRQSHMCQATPTSNGNTNQARNHFQVNRRFSTDCPPPSYSDATNFWKQPASKQKYLSRQNGVIASKGSLIADDDASKIAE